MQNYISLLFVLSLEYLIIDSGLSEPIDSSNFYKVYEKFGRIFQG